MNQNRITEYTITNETPDGFLNKATDAVRSNSALGFTAIPKSDLPNQTPEEYEITKFRQLFTDEEGNQRIIGNIVDGRLAVISVGEAAISLAMRHAA